MNNKKEYDLTFWMNNGDVFKILGTADTKENLTEWLVQNINNQSFLGNESGTAFVNMKNVNYFEIKEKEEVTA